MADFSLTVEWQDRDSDDMGSQSLEMMGAAESGCCRQSGSPCSPKKFSNVVPRLSTQTGAEKNA